MTDPNQHQIEFWNADPAQKWIRYRPSLDRLLSNVAERLFALAAPAAGEAVLDVGCGAGATTLTLGETVGPGGAVLGLDVSADLLAEAERRRQAAGADAVRFVRGDAQVYALEADRFDLAISRFGVMFFDDPAAAFANLRRALRPGGRFCFAAWDGAAANPWFSDPRAAAIAVAGEPAPTDPTAPGPLAFADADRVSGLLTAAGMRNVEALTEDLTLIVDGDAADAAALAVQVGPAQRILREHEADEAAASLVAAEVAARFARYEDPAGVTRIPARVHFFRGARPA